jgi:hypothetical protein
MQIRSIRGVARTDILACAGCAVIACTIGSLVPGQAEDRVDPAGFQPHPKSMKDAAQLRAIHQSWLIFAREFSGILPTPGLIDRLPFNGQEIPGRGEEDINANTTANLYSACIMHNYFTPELIISPVERNPKVRVMADYDYEAFDPVKDVYWDARFKADLTAGSNVSYAHMPIYGQRKLKEWRDTSNSAWPLLGNRGPKDGKADPSSYTCGPHGNWAGNVVFSDNHSQPFQKSTSIPLRDGQLDNIFASDDANGTDAILTFTREITDKGPVFQFD